MTRSSRIALNAVLGLSLLLTVAVVPAAVPQSIAARAPIGRGTAAPDVNLPPVGPLSALFNRVAARSGVPASLLMAVSYVQSLWRSHGDTPSIDGGYGLMDLVRNPQRDTLDEAAHLLRVTAAQVQRTDELNVLGGAMLLARAARTLSPRHTMPRTLGAWAPAVVWLTGMRTSLAADVVLRDVYRTVGRIVPSGQSSGLSGPGRVVTIKPDMSALGALHLQEQLRPRSVVRSDSADYPGAAWAPSPNYTPANRPLDLDVKYVVIHDTEGGCAASLSWLDNPASEASAHFLICQDGTVYQLVRIKDIAWHAGNWYVNQHSIGIEHEGFRDSGGYTPAQYDVSAAIVQWLVHNAGLHIDLDRNAILGHENVPNATHTDPGPNWNWNYYMSQVRGGTAYDVGSGQVVMVSSPQAAVYACPDATCSVRGSADWGEQFAVIAVSNGWVEVDFNGAAAWINGSNVVSGAGTRLQVALPTLKVRDEPAAGGAAIGTVACGQIYVSRLMDTSLEPNGWWLIAYNHRYGFVSNSYVQPLTVPGQSAVTPSPTPTSTISGTTTPTRGATPTPIRSTTPTTTRTATSTATPSSTPTPSASPTAITTATATATPSGTAAVTASPGAATRAISATPALTGSPSPTATTTMSPTPTVTASCLSTPPTAVVPPRLTTLTISLPRRAVRLGEPLRLRVQTNVGAVALRYRVALPAHLVVQASGRTDSQGNGAVAFIMPGSRWLKIVLRSLSTWHNGRRVMPRVPHSLGGGYSVRAQWHGRTLTRSGTFRLVLWGAI